MTIPFNTYMGDHFVIVGSANKIKLFGKVTPAWPSKLCSGQAVHYLDG